MRWPPLVVLLNMSIDKTRAVELAPAYGGSLVDLIPGPEEQQELRRLGNELSTLQISLRSAYDLELLATGGFSPLDRFMGQLDHQRVLDEMRLSSGKLFPIPITLPVPQDTKLSLDNEIALRDQHNDLLAVMRVEEIYPWNLATVAQAVFGTEDLRHPLVAEMHGWGTLNISGKLRVVSLPPHHDFNDLRLTPRATRERLSAMGRHNVVAFQTRNPLHRAHEEMTKQAIESVDGVLLLHPVVGMTRPGDVDHYTRVRTYKVLAANYYSAERILLALLPLAMRLAGPREALWHALIRRNYGANHIIIGRDHASPGKDSHGEPFYPPYAAQQLVEQHATELGVAVLSFNEFVYLPDSDSYAEVTELTERVSREDLSGTRIRTEFLDPGVPLPTWYARPEVAAILADSHPPKHRQGICLWFTGLSGAGKSTTAEVVTSLLLEHGRKVTLLDGDVVRTHLSKGLGFDKQDRDTNIRRIGFVAAEIARHGGVAVCAAVSPYRATRNDVRRMVGGDHFIEVFVDTPLEICETRDTKGMYARARRGEIRGFTGIDDPYEAPENPEIVINTVNRTPKQNADLILDYLHELGFIQ